MEWIRRLGRAGAAVLEIVLHDGWPALCAVWARLAAVLRARREAKRRRPGREGRATEAICVPIREPAYKRPDPTIYCQGYLMAQGLAVTWDNPDVVLRRGGVAVPSSSLLPDTEYEIVARVWNNSTEAPVPGLPVRFSYATIGAGTPDTPIGDTAVDLGVKGGPNHPAFATVAWRTPAEAGHYCIRVLLDWFDDVNPANNLGQENTLVAPAHSPAEFEFTLHNDGRERRAYWFEADAYELPEPQPCGEARPRIDDQSAPRAPGSVRRPEPGAHDRRRHPLPQGWTLELEPKDPVLAPGEAVLVRGRCEPPAGFHGERRINVNAFHEDGLTGGVTVLVQAS